MRKLVVSKPTKKLIDWSVALGPYPGLIMGMRDYTYNDTSVVEDEKKYTTKDRVIYLPFFMVIFTFIYAEPIKKK